jgi:hypothetical protein
MNRSRATELHSLSAALQTAIDIYDSPDGPPPLLTTLAAPLSRLINSRRFIQSGFTRYAAVRRQPEGGGRFVKYQTRIAEIESAVRLLKVARPFEVDLQRLRIHLRMVQEDISRMGAVN